jgi:putative SOS response-associated peptidase YedK
MCGRFTLTIEALDAEKEFELESVPDHWQQRFNIAPTQPVAVLSKPGQHRVEFMHWGLIPSWAKDPGIGTKMINARAETVSEKPAFRAAFAHRHCLILADGFYEWQRTEGKKGKSIPFYFHLKDRRPFAFAGLWESWQSRSGETVCSCTIITCSANDFVKEVHDRMPVILTGDRRWAWLSLEHPGENHALLTPFPAGEMAAYPVSTLVNSPSIDTQACIQPVGV